MWDEKFENTLRESLPFLAPDEELREDMSLMGAGLDSMGIVQLLSRLEDAYDVRFRDEALTLETFETPGTLWKVLTGLR
ncbi:phosphopantetheine-binding protein [Marinactinospora thermotolerans]|nr:phosphopantetheine-binding protein [Marinactinospora thermotolerans]